MDYLIFQDVQLRTDGLPFTSGVEIDTSFDMETLILKKVY